MTEVDVLSSSLCLGKLFGRTPLIKLSPKKTVEGFVGAFICTLIFGLAVRPFLLPGHYDVAKTDSSSVEVGNFFHALSIHDLSGSRSWHKCLIASNLPAKPRVPLARLRVYWSNKTTPSDHGEYRVRGLYSRADAHLASLVTHRPASPTPRFSFMSWSWRHLLHSSHPLVASSPPVSRELSTSRTLATRFPVMVA